MKKVACASIALLSAVLALACNTTSPKKRISATARFVNGASPSSPLITSATRLASSTLASAVPANGRWFISPEKITMKLKHVFFSGPDQTENIPVDCTVTYDRSKPGLAQLADCPFTVPPGRYNAVTVFFDKNIDYLVNDPATGFYSTATGIVTTPPSGGAVAYTLSLGTNAEVAPSPMQFPTTLNIADSASLTVSIVVNGIQSLRVDVNGGAVTPGWAGTPNSTNIPPDLVAAVGTLAGVEFYASQALNTTGSFCAGGACANPPTGITAVSVYYSSASTPAMVGMQFNGTPSICGPFGVGFMNSAKGYLGLDAQNNLGWAIGSDQNFTSYTLEMRMARVTSLGGSTTVYCKNRSTDPAPPGGTYASGAPAIAAAANSLGTYLLLAR